MAKDKHTRDERKARRRARRIEAVAAMGPDAMGTRPDPAEVLGDIDAWNLRVDGGWLRFDARLEDGPRGYLRPVAGGDILADAPGPLLALLGIGGARRAGFNAGPARFRYNVVAPFDHIGSVGLEGTARAEAGCGLQHLPHRSREALLADRLLASRYAARRGLPLIFVRCETDGSAGIAALRDGVAMDNLLMAMDNLCAAAYVLNRAAQVVAVGLDFGPEDVVTADAAAFAQGMRDLMARITAEMRLRGLAPPVFLAVAEAGDARSGDHPAIRAMWELVWCPGPHRLIVSTPAYVVELDAQGRPLEAARQRLADYDALALDAVAAGEGWLCPLPLLAEYRGTEIRVTFRALAGLVIDGADPFGAGPQAGFLITGGDRPVKILSVAVAPDDPCALLLGCDAVPGGAARLVHAIAGTGAGAGSAVRDGWQGSGSDGVLHRWALPADLPLHPAPDRQEAAT